MQPCSGSLVAVVVSTCQVIQWFIYSTAETVCWSAQIISTADTICTVYNRRDTNTHTYTPEANCVCFFHLLIALNCSLCVLCVLLAWSGIFPAGRRGIVCTRRKLKMMKRRLVTFTFHQSEAFLLRQHTLYILYFYFFFWDFFLFPSSTASTASYWPLGESLFLAGTTQHCCSTVIKWRKECFSVCMSLALETWVFSSLWAKSVSSNYTCAHLFSDSAAPLFTDRLQW